MTVSLLVITDQWGRTALHWDAYDHSNPAVLELLIREHPLALCPTDSSGSTPQQLTTNYNRPAPITSLLTDASAALASLDFPVLAARVHGDELDLHCFISPLGFRLLTRVNILICLHRLAYNCTSPTPRSTQWSGKPTPFF